MEDKCADAATLVVARPSDGEGTGNEWPNGDVAGEVTCFDPSATTGLDPGEGV